MWNYAYVSLVALCLLQTVSAVILYARGCGVRIRPLAKTLSRLAKQIRVLPPCAMENLAAAEKMLGDSGEEAGRLRAAFSAFKNDSLVMLRGHNTPEVTGYFEYRRLFGVPSLGHFRDIMLRLTVFYGIASIALPAAFMLFDDAQASVMLQLIIGVSLMAFVVILLVYLIFCLFESNIAEEAHASLEDFIMALRGALPSAGRASEAALLLEGGRQNREAFEFAAQIITEKIDAFTSTEIAPAASRAFEEAIAAHIAPVLRSYDATLSRLSEVISEKQDEGLRALADSFAEKLSGTVSAKIEALGAGVEQVNGLLSGTNGALSEITEKIASAMEEDREILRRAGEMTAEAAAMQKNGADNIGALADYLGETKLVMGEVRTQTAAVLEKIEAAAERNNEISAGNARIYEESKAELNNASAEIRKSVDEAGAQLKSAFDANAETAERLAKISESISEAGTAQFEKAAEAASHLLENVVAEMNKAMDGVGREIAESIAAANAGSMEIVEKLTAQTVLLKQEYDSYFIRIEEQTKTSYDDLDFHMQNILARFSGEAGEVIDRLHESITGAMNLFESNTQSLISSLEEQSGSIGLYAKEINLDIQELTTGLRESVGIFSEKLREGVEGTFDDFDDGLADIGKRLANTVESIRDSVEGLPAILADNPKPGV